VKDETLRVMSSEGECVGGPRKPTDNLQLITDNRSSGGREGIRTLDLSVANAALSQLSYAPTGLTDF
jgi:hypothetical protein